MTKKQGVIKRIFSGLLLLTIAAGCSRAVAADVTIGVLSGGIPGRVSLETAPVAFEQQAGYELGTRGELDSLGLIQASEGNLQDDVQTAIRSMVEEDQVLAIVGATTDEATMRAASLVNFFNVPMVISTAGGDNLLPSNNLWVFRLSAPSSAYAGFIFENVLQAPAAASAQIDNGSAPVYQGPKLAIIYEQNTFGESGAVTSVRAALKQSMDIVYYGSFVPGVMDEESINVLAQDVKASGARLIYLLSSDPLEAWPLSSTLKKSTGAIVIGQAGGFASQSFLNASEAGDVYVVRQTLDSTGCPTGVDTLYKAQSYAAVYLLEEAVRQSQAEEVKVPLSAISSLSKTQVDPLLARREKVRDILKQANMKVPCLGQVSFDNSGQNKNLQFELLQIKDGQATLISPDDFRETLEMAGVFSASPMIK